MNCYRSNWHQKELFRSSKDKVLAGVCGGLAKHFNVASIWVRLAAVLSFFIFNGLAIVAYIVMAIIMKKSEQSAKKHSAEKATKSTIYSRSAESAKARMAEIDQRLANVERYVTSNRYRLNKQFEELR